MTCFSYNGHLGISLCMCQDRLVAGGPIFLTHKGLVFRTTLQNSQFTSMSAVLERGTVKRSYFKFHNERNKIDDGGSVTPRSSYLSFQSFAGVSSESLHPIWCPVITGPALSLVPHTHCSKCLTTQHRVPWTQHALLKQSQTHPAQVVAISISWILCL